MSATQAVGRARMPWQFWVIGAVALAWNAMGALDYVMTQTRNASYLSSYTAEQLAYFDSFPAWVVAAWAIAVWGGVLGSILLLLRKRLAVPVFLVSLVAMVVTTIHNFVLSNGFEVMGGAGPATFTALIFVIALALYLYARSLDKRGALH